jgi:hypothetical protein
MEDSDLSDLTDRQRETLLNFSEITNITDLNLCRSILYSNDWNLEVSVDNFVRNRDIRQSTQNHDNAGANSAPNLRRDNDMFQMMLAPLRWLFQSSPESLNPQQDASRFCDKFKLEYGEDSPQLLDVSYNNAVAQAYRQSKFLLVYLHSPLHEDTGRFCRYSIAGPMLPH